MNDADRDEQKIATLTEACAAYSADPTPATWTALLVADDMAGLAVGREVVL